MEIVELEVDMSQEWGRLNQKIWGKPKIRSVKNDMAKLCRTRFNLNTAKCRTILSGSRADEKTYCKILGCDYLYLRERMLKDFNMTMPDDCHIDHIIPRAVASQLAIREFVQVDFLERLINSISHYSNLRILSSEDNLDLLDKIDGFRVSEMESMDILEIANEIIRDTEVLRV